MKILLIRPDMIGDCLLITPAIHLLKQKYPNSKLSILCLEYTKSIFENNPDIDEVITDKESIKPKKFDLSIHFFNELKYALLAKQAGIPIRIGDTSKPLISWLYTQKAKQNWNNLFLHEVEHNCELLKPLGIDIANPPPMQLSVPKEGEEFAKKFAGKIIGIHLGTGKGNKAYLAERFAKIVDELIERHQATVILTGSKKELKASEIIMRTCKHKPINLVHKTNLNQLIGIISKMDIFIGTDTGPLHIAAALGKKIVAIFATKFVKPSEWGPWKTPHIIVRKKIKCNLSCLPAKCLFDDCLKQIQPKEIINAVDKLLEGKTHSEEDWLRLSYNILTNDEKTYTELSSERYNVVKLSSYSIFDIIKIIKKEDINVIHWVGNSGKINISLARLLSTPSAPIPPLLIIDKKRKSSNYKELIDRYNKAFRQRKYL